MSVAALGVCFDVPPRRELPPARREAIRRLLEDRVAQAPPHRPWRRPARLGLALAAGAAVVAAVTVGLVSPLNQQAVAHPVPDPLVGTLDDGTPAEPELRMLIQKAAASPSKSGGGPRVRVESWALAVLVHGDGRVELQSGPTLDVPAVVPTLREQTWLPDGTVHVREIQAQPQHPSAEPVRGWDEDGTPLKSSVVLVDGTFPAATIDWTHPRRLSTEPGKLREQLLAAAPQANDVAAALIQEVREVHFERPVKPALRLAMLRVLAEEPGIVSLGLTTDRLGRQAVVVAADGDDSGWFARDMLLLDPRDGRVLGYESVVLGDTGEVPLETPSVRRYDAFL